MKISVIIPAFNEEKLIAESLVQVRRAMEAFSEAGWESELIVCDNNSTDRTAELARAAGAKVVFEPVNQIARARNCGAAAATGDWLLFIDADSHPSRALLGGVVEAITSGKYIGGGSTLTLNSPQRVAMCVTQLWNGISRVFKFMAGSFIFCDAAAFREIGGFSKELYASEELDLSKKLKALARKRGKRLVILNKHPLVTSARKMQIYSAREHLLFLMRTILGGGATLTNREACHIWYDGRR